jgi:hypothetical protein
MKPTRLRGALAFLAFSLPLVVYICTLAREITFVDSGELSAVAATLGIAHPPGYPLFTLIGHLLSLLPVGTMVFRVGLMSALAAALTSLLIYQTATTLLSGLLSQSPTEIAQRATPGPGESRLTVIARALGPLTGALLFAFAKTPWSQAAVVEIYTLQALLVMLFLAACARALAAPARALTHWPWVAFTAGLALTNHLTGVLLLPGLLFFLVVALIDRARSRMRVSVPFWRGIGAGVLPLLLYLYLPLRSHMTPPVNWDYPETLHRFLVHITARQYHGALGRQGIRMEELERFATQQLPAEATCVLITLAGIGLVTLLWRSWRFGLVGLVSAGTFILYNMAYPIHDVYLYYLPTLATLGLWAAIGAAVLVRLATKWHAAAGVVVGVALCLTCLFPLTAHWRENDQHDFKLLAHYVKDTLGSLDSNAFLFSGRWDRFSSPALYYQTVAGCRTDVVVIDMGSLSSAVLQKRLSGTAPDLVAACRDEMEAVAEITRLSELGRPYDLPEARARFAKLQRALLERAVELRPTYITSDLHRHPMLKGFHLIPEGLVARVAREDLFRPFPTPPFTGPGITRAQTRNRQEMEVFSEYGRMLRNRARFLERHGRRSEAVVVARRAAEVSR